MSGAQAGGWGGAMRNVKAGVGREGDRVCNEGIASPRT